MAVITRPTHRTKYNEFFKLNSSPAPLLLTHTCPVGSIQLNINHLKELNDILSFKKHYFYLNKLFLKRKVELFIVISCSLGTVWIKVIQETESWRKLKNC